MASATRKTVEKTITEDVIVLELNQDEVDCIKELLECQDPDDAVIASLSKALETPSETDDRPIEVGDKVRVLEADENYRELDFYIGKVGIVTNISQSRCLSFYVKFDEECEGDNEWYVNRVERVND